MKSKNGMMAIVAAISLMGLGYVCWRLERYVHYKFSYQSMVQEQIDLRVKPLEVRIQHLETQVQVLSTNK